MLIRPLRRGPPRPAARRSARALAGQVGLVCGTLALIIGLLATLFA